MKKKNQEIGLINKHLYIKGFDGLRAVSILMVLFTHLGFFDPLLQSKFNTRIWHCISGETGVNIFFTISGFLITMLLLQEKVNTSFINYKKFIFRRVLRLLPPLMIFYTMILLLMIMGMLEKNYLSLIISFIYLYNFIPNKFYVTELGHTWSLGVEEQFYLIWPFAIKYLRKINLIPMAMGIILLSIASVVFIPKIELLYNNQQFIVGEKFRPQRFILPAISPIIIGCLFSIVCFYTTDKNSQLFKNLLFLFLAATFIISPLFLPESMLPFLMIIQAIGFSTILAYIYFNQESQLTNFLELNPIRFIGRISYGIYIWQGLFLRTGPGGSLWIQQFPQNIILTFVVAILSYFTIEKYFRKWRMNLH